jgi:hypothetical protein
MESRRLPRENRQVFAVGLRESDRTDGCRSERNGDSVEVFMAVPDAAWNPDQLPIGPINFSAISLR